MSNIDWKERAKLQGEIIEACNELHCKLGMTCKTCIHYSKETHEQPCLACDAHHNAFYKWEPNPEYVDIQKVPGKEITIKIKYRD